MPQQVPITMSENCKQPTLDDDGPNYHASADVVGQGLKNDVKSTSEELFTNKDAVDVQIGSCSNLSDTKPGATLANDEVPTTIVQKQIEPMTSDGCQTYAHSTAEHSTTDRSAPTLSTNTTTSVLQSSTTKAPTKLNGLKNRIIQRPPPLVLDKVSNFYDNETESNSTQSVQTNTAGNASASANNATNLDKFNDRLVQSKPKPLASSANSISDDQLAERSNQATNAANSNNSSANQKFWASLNENASRNKALASARAAVHNATYNTNQQEIDAETNTINLGKDFLDSTDTFGADLVIRHRNTNGNISTSRVVSTKKPEKSYRSASKTTSESETQSASVAHQSSLNFSRTSNRSQEVLSSSGEQDDGTAQSEHGGSVGGGGNIIGVDNSTPPATSVLSHNVDGLPLSANSSLPRSNNPFLDNDDDDDGFVSDSRAVSRKQQVGNFHKRPASFIAATTSDKFTPGTGPFADNPSASEQQKMEADFNNINMTGNQNQNHLSSHADATSGSYASNLNYGSIYVDQHLGRAFHTGSNYHSNNLINHVNPKLAHDMMNPYGTNLNRNKMSEQSISLDSESTVSQPPPSATMQLPHWTDAIYELNNAILDTNSVAGGADNSQFIYIAESGDIVLELDKIKVSGFTLIEFNELVESKQFHLLKAVQTKHSYGLTHDLKHYLNQSFPKSSSDKALQNLIRENIYKRTIPCTTRAPRPGEEDKVDYHFLTSDQFIELDSRGMLLEGGIFGGHYYGTLKPLCDLNILSIYQSFKQPADNMRQTWDANHPAIELTNRADPKRSSTIAGNPLYENHESMLLHCHKPPSNIQAYQGSAENPNASMMQQQVGLQRDDSSVENNRIVDDSELLPPGWERVIDPTHGAYYIDHNTRRTQYEKPYEVELTKGSMGFGFTLVEADNGMLLVRSIIQGGPAQLNGSIKPGDILISAVGISVAGLQHTDVARLFSTFAVGDRVRLTFAKSNHVLDNIIPDEYLFSNGTNGDLAIAVNYHNFQPNMDLSYIQGPHVIVNQEFEFINVTLRKGDQGFGFTISDSMAGQKVRKIQNDEVCTNLKEGDILMSMNGEDITSMTHKEIVERLKNCPSGEDVRLTVKRKKRFRSKTPMAMHTDATVNRVHSLETTPQRKCKTPSLDGLMLMCPVNRNSNLTRPSIQNREFQAQPSQLLTQQLITSMPQQDNVIPVDYAMTGLPAVTFPHTQMPREDQIYGVLPESRYFVPSSEPYDFNSNNSNYASAHQTITAKSSNQSGLGRPDSIQSTDLTGRDDVSNTAQASESCLPTGLNSNMNELSQKHHQYNNFMQGNNFMVQQIHQPQPIYHMLPPETAQIADCYQLPLYSNSEIINGDFDLTPALPAKPMMNHNITQSSYLTPNNYQDDYYANNEEIAIQNVQYNGIVVQQQQQAFASDPMAQSINYANSQEDLDDYEYHHVDLERENSDSNWGIRLIGGAEVDRAISIGSIVFGGAASKNGQLRSGDEIISINGIGVVGATHQHVVELISACTTRSSLVVRRKKFAEACDVVLTRNMDEGFGFVIISSGNCALIGRIIEGSPADRCKQLHIRDRIIAVNGRYIAPNMRHPQIVSMIKECGSTLRLRIVPVDCYTVELIKNAQNDNFGFSIRGGSEYDGTPLYILRVASNGLARDLLNVGDQILEINNIPTVGMTHQQAATIIKYSDPIVKLKLRRNYVTPASLLVDSPRELQKFNQVTAEIIAVNQNATPNNSQVAIVASDGLNDSLQAKPFDHTTAASEFGSTQSVPVVGINSIPMPPHHLQQSTSLTLDHQPVDQRRQTSSLQYGNQSQPLYA